MSKILLLIATSLALTNTSPIEAFPKLFEYLKTVNLQKVFAGCDKVATQTIDISIIIVKNTAAAADIWCANHKEP